MPTSIAIAEGEAGAGRMGDQHAGRAGAGFAAIFTGDQTDPLRPHGKRQALNSLVAAGVAAEKSEKVSRHAIAVSMIAMCDGVGGAGQSPRTPTHIPRDLDLLVCSAISVDHERPRNVLGIEKNLQKG